MASGGMRPRCLDRRVTRVLAFRRDCERYGRADARWQRRRLVRRA